MKETTKNGWIPVSERLPGKEDCQRYDFDNEEPIGIFWVTILQNRSGLTYTTKMCYRPGRGIWYRNGSEMNRRSGWTGHRIVAWMPMDIPEPYQMNEQMVRDREKENWLKFYMTFNDDNRCHAEEAFESNGLSDASYYTLVEKNKEWYKEVLSHGISEEEICKSMPEAAEYAPQNN